MFDISTDVMRRLGPLGFIHLEDQVEQILERRTRDSKTRPIRTAEQLHLYQERSRSVCRAFAAALEKPIHEFRADDSAEFLRAIQTTLNTGSQSPAARSAN
jgi:adenylate kinase